MLSTTAVSNVRKLRRSRAAVSIACCAVMLVLASGCQTDKDKPGAGATPVDHASKPTAAPGGPNQPASGQRASAFRSPLTGLGSEREVRERPVAVMVENAPQARPQSGLDQADIVYEVLAEGEITRFVAVYQSGSPSVIGPVRSIRPYFVKLGEGFDAMIVHAGWSQDAMDLIADHNINHLDEVYGDGTYYWRSKDRKAPHNLYTSMDNIRKAAVNKKFRTDWSGASPVFASSAVAAPTPQQGAGGTGTTAASTADMQPRR
jgi:hypothetical protein